MKIKYSQAARNFVSVFPQAPPCLNAKSLSPVEPSKIGSASVGDHNEVQAALAALAGEFYLWYWLVRGDGFDVTQWVVAEYLGDVLAMPSSTRSQLTEMGSAMWEKRNAALVFKKNAGKYVGNYNWLRLLPLTRRADLLVMKGLGLGASEAEHVFDYVTRVLSINVQAGEKGIPDAVRSNFPVPVTSSGNFGAIDAALCAHYGWNETQLHALLHEVANPHVVTA